MEFNFAGRVATVETADAIMNLLHLIDFYEKDTAMRPGVVQIFESFHFFIIFDRDVTELFSAIKNKQMK